MPARTGAQYIERLREQQRGKGEINGPLEYGRPAHCMPKLKKCEVLIEAEANRI